MMESKNNKSFKNYPNHIALIPDGNRRWAKRKGLSAMFGHEKGAETLEKVLDKALELKIPYFTFWGLSLDNVLKRPKKEIDFIYKIIERQFNKLADDERVHKNKVKITAIGRYLEYFPATTKEAIEKAINKTKNYSQYRLTFLMAYNGTDELVECVKKIQRKGIKSVNEKTIKDNLWTQDLPPVDFIIRTGSENDPHLSAGFMMWDAAYAQLYFTETYFPDFGAKEFEKAALDYAERERRVGK
ncbi:MAG: polyprenyl diphosphate synthase [Candidatus Pacebacteria bacterium]|nr:polyprenyl diphosphate synthase [Candidatus Paceibacterota bacterium]